MQSNNKEIQHLHVIFRKYRLQTFIHFIHFTGNMEYLTVYTLVGQFKPRIQTNYLLPNIFSIGMHFEVSVTVQSVNKCGFENKTISDIFAT